jgi:hypothetical protein
VAKDNITISMERYTELIMSERKLNALEAAGVDNWDGYDWAMEELQDEEET